MPHRVGLPAAVFALLLLSVPTSAQVVPGGDGAGADVFKAEFLAYVMEHSNTLLGQWRVDWRSDDVGALTARYSQESIFSPPGSGYLFGHESIQGHLEALLPRTGEMQASILDFDASERLGYMSGSFQMEANATGGVSGHHLTVVIRTDDKWHIRHQMLDGGGWPAPVRGPELEPLTQASVGSLLSSEYAIELFPRVEYALGDLRDHWKNRSWTEAAELFTEDGLLRLPGADARSGREGVRTTLETVGSAARDLHISVLDFEASGRMAFAHGRYYFERVSGTPSIGSYTAVLVEQGRDWRIRALALAEDPG